ncbi:MAG TPA: Rpn family recombination-promoting nuclease/putative transposase, partial [Opitutales bacterium]|nr:Rpn family recombination-promoting nuclease/putative transposase [Opitutales bacterium]
DTPSIFNQPHDALFKSYLRDLNAAKSFLDIYLPPAIKQQCDFSTLKVENGSYVDSGLKQTHTDVLYSLKIAQQTGFVYVLVKHQSKPDKLMPARMLRYQTSIATDHFEKHGRFPRLIPVLFYAGKQSPYPYSCNLNDYVHTPEQSHEVISSTFKLIDLTTIPYETLKGHQAIELLELVMKQSCERDLLNALRYLEDRCYGEMQIPSHEVVKRVFEYLLQTNEDMRFTERLTNYMGEPYKEDIMTIAERLEEQGIQKGIYMGREEGIELGTMATAIQFLALGVAPTVISQATGLTLEKLDWIAANELR